MLYLVGLGLSLPVSTDELKIRPVAGSMSAVQNLLQTAALFYLFKRNSSVWFKRVKTTA